jgi:hypothetical protein
MLAQEAMSTPRENRPQTGKASSDTERNWRPVPKTFGQRQSQRAREA